MKSQFKGDYSILEKPWMSKSRVDEIIDGMVEQAQRQLDASGSGTILEWFFKDEHAADLFRDALDDANISGINVYVVE